MYHIFFIYSSVEGHLGCFHVLAMTNNAAIMNIIEHMFLWKDSSCFGYIIYPPKSGIAGSLERLFPNYLRNHHTDFQSGWTSLHFQQQWRRVLFKPYPLQHKLSSMFLILDILIGVRWNLRAVFICISLMAKNVETFP